jgi:hypothetical protein
VASSADRSRAPVDPRTPRCTLIGGGTDINLVPQDATLNVSAGWRRLERFAQSHPGAFVAVEVIYDDQSQTPARFVYLVAENRLLEYEHFENG